MFDFVLDMIDRLLRETVLSIACQMGDTAALNEASRIFDGWIGGNIRYQITFCLLICETCESC